MSTYTTMHYDVLLAQMVRSPSIMLMATSQLDAAFFPNPKVGGSVHQGFMFHLLSEYFKQFKCAPDRAAMVANYQAQAQHAFPFSNSDDAKAALTWLTGFLNIMDVVDGRSEDLARDVVVYIHQLCIYEPQAFQLVDSARETGVYDGIGEQLRVLEAQHKGIKGSGATMLNLDLTVAEGEDEERVLTGCSFIDRLLGRGKGPTGSCVLAIIAGQGVGKTTLGLQMAVQQAMRGRYIILVLAENGLNDISLKRNIVACCTGISTDVLEDTKGDIEAACKISGLDYEIVKARQAALAKYCIVEDIAGTDENLDRLANRLVDMEQRGLKPSLCYVDWAGIIADRLVSTGHQGREFKTKNDALQFMSYQVTEMADRHKMLICVSQQMSTAAYAKGPFANNDHYCAADCRMFTAPFKYVFVLNAKDEKTGIQKFIVAKSRNDPGGQVSFVRRMGPFACFTEVEGYTQVGKRFVPASPTKANASGFSIPTETR